MTEDENKLLVRKRHLELEMLGIAPQLFYNACKLIDRLTLVVIKNGDVLVLKRDTQHSGQKFNNNKYITTKSISNNIKEVYGMNESLSRLIINEWIRDTIIRLNMERDITSTWEFLSMNNNIKETDDGYNF